MINSIATLILAGAVMQAPASAQTSQIASTFALRASADKTAPQAPAAPIAPIAPLPPVPDVDLDLDVDVDLEDIAEQTREIREQAEALAEQFKHQEFQVYVDKEVTAKIGRRMLELRRQGPVPPVPPVPKVAGDARRPRDRQRRRIPAGWVESTEPFSRAFPVGRGATLMLSNISGNIQVVPGTGERIEVEALKHAWGPNAEQAKNRLADAVVETYATANRVEVRVEHGQRRDARGIDVDFTVKVPADAAVDLRTISGDVRVMNVKGEVRVQGVSGNVNLEGTARIAAVKTVSGDIALTNAGSDVPVSLSTVNGDLQVQSLSARAIDVDTINGDVRIAGWSGDRAHIRSLDGDLDLQAGLTKGGRYEIESHSGDVTLALAEQPGFELEANTFSGRIRIDFPIRSEGPIRDSDRGPRSVRGTYGDGSSSLRLQTFGGDLTVTRR